MVIVAEHAGECVVASLSPVQYEVMPGTNLAGEARDGRHSRESADQREQVRVAPADVSIESAMQRGALSRAAG